MGWTVLYIAFGIVALWLLGEVLLQYKARLRWRLLAFAGFLGVVLGVLIPSVIVIGLGAAAFAVGQTYVTLSFRRGFSAGWAVKRPEGDGLGAGLKGRRGKAERRDPTLEVSELEPEADTDYGPERAAYTQGASFGADDDYDRDDVFTPARPTAAESTAVYEPQPLPDDTGSYGVYSDSSYAAADPSYANAGQAQDQYATAAQGADQTYGYDYSGYGQQQYGYDTTGQQQYAAYSDPYIGTQTYGGGYDANYDQYAQQGYSQEQYGTGGYGETPSGGVWVPQQRTDETYGGELPPEQQYPYQGNDQQQQGGAGYDEQQYRF
ncbi:SCO2102 family sporulation regulator [Streptomyces sp. NPDC001759]